MLTFSEACAATFMRKSDTPDIDNAEFDKMREELRPSRWDEIHQEVQGSVEAQVFVLSLLQMCAEGCPAHKALGIAFSHGVIVGIAMESQEIEIKEPPNDIAPSS